MKTDRYTRTILTIIAALLALIALRPGMTPRDARADDPMPVKIVEIGEAFRRPSIAEWGPIRVQIVR